MRMSNIKMTTRVERAKLLATLRANLAEHRRIVEDARLGYVEKAKRALESRLAQLRDGRPVALGFHDLKPPVDHSEVYRNSIEMLEWNTQEFVDLEADEFRQLVRDEWDWTDGFLQETSGYSALAAAKRK